MVKDCSLDESASTPLSCNLDFYPTDDAQLMASLDKPQLFPPDEDEMCVLKQFANEDLPDSFDMSLELSDEDLFGGIMHELSTTENEPDNSTYSVKLEDENWDSSSGSNSPVGVTQPIQLSFNIEDKIKKKQSSPSTIIMVPKSPHKSVSPYAQATTRRVPIQPKIEYSNIIPATKIILNPPPPVVTNNMTKVAPFNKTATTTCSPITINKCLTSTGSSIDYDKFFKRQQRKIKNRESACLSRKKKRDYLNSLEAKVKELTSELQKLRVVNNHLTEKLSKYEALSSPVLYPIKRFKESMFLAAFLFTVGFNFYPSSRSPFASTSKENLLLSHSLKVHQPSTRNLLWVDDLIVNNNISSNNNNNTSNFLPYSMCPAAINQTESARLVLELERWIGKPTKGPHEYMSADQPAQSFPLKIPVRSHRKRKQKKSENQLVPSIYSMGRKLSRMSSNAELQVFSPSPDHLYSEFFEAINRQDDTYYVVSFSEDHMLLPALYHNKTRRPKMSLIMPSVLPNDNTSHPMVPLMQIDCEVLDTRLLQVRPGSIPEHLRTHGNTTAGDTKSKPSYKPEPAYEPYLLREGAEKPSLLNVH